MEAVNAGPFNAALPPQEARQVEQLLDENEHVRACVQADMADANTEIDAESAAYDLDISRPESGEMLVSEDDEPAARLDLAEAYLQIGDLEAAREILDDLRDHEDGSIASRCKTLLERL